MGLQNIKAWESGEERHSGGTSVFCSLHHHSTFSYLDGFGMPEDHVKRAAELDMFAIALTEHGNVSSHVKLEQAAKKYGVKPIFGCEFYAGGVGEDATQLKNHLTVLAETQEGYLNLLRMVSTAWATGFYYQPTISGAMLKEHAEGLVVLSGCQGSLLATSLIGGKNVAVEDASYASARKVAQGFKRLLGDRYYLEVQAHPELEKSRLINAGLAKLSRELGIPLVATLDAHYTKPDEGHMQAILHSVRSGNRKSAEDLEQSWGYDVPLCPLTDADVTQRLQATGLTQKQAQQAVRNTRLIAEQCTVELPKVANLRYPLPPGVPDARTLYRRWLNEGWKYRGFDKLPLDIRKEWQARAKYEMGLIEEKDFVDYFLVIADAVRYAKDNGIPVGPARGSAAASLVCYLLRITEVNPMLFPTLVFERFIDRNRHDLPDIDLDFDDERRWEVRQYLVDKYGAERVGNIGTFTYYKGKNSLNDVQSAKYRDNWQCKGDVETVKGLLIERKSGDLRANATVEDTMEMFPEVRDIFERWPELLRAQELEGNVRGMSVHAAGLVVANSPLTDFTAIYTRHNDKGEILGEVVALDKHDAEYLNALKIDALGLKTMAMIRICLEQIGMTLEELYAIPLDDEETIRGFQENDVVGVFQFDGRAMQNVNQGVKPDNFFEIADVNALARPGPLHSGATGQYIDIKHGRAEATRYHAIIDRITEHTQGQVVYQEQILQIVRELGGFSWEESARIRKIISKKRGEQEFNTMRAKFRSGAAKHGLDSQDADRVFSMLATAGAYAFNAAHCVSYGMLAFWTMWLKRHHPTAFYVACLRKVGNGKDAADKKRSLLKDAYGHGIKVGSLVVDGEGTWWTDGDCIRPGWVQVPGIGEKTAEAIVAYGLNHGPLHDWYDLRGVKGVGPKTVESIEAFSNDPDPFEVFALAEKLQQVRDILASGVPMDPDEDNPEPYMLPVPTHRSTDVPYEKTSDHVLCTWVGVVRERNLKDLFELHHSRTGEHLDPNTVKDPHLNEWVVFTCEDETDLMVVTIDRWKYRRMKKEAWDIKLNDDVVLVRGLKKKYQARRAIYVTQMWVLEE